MAGPGALGLEVGVFVGGGRRMYRAAVKSLCLVCRRQKFSSFYLIDLLTAKVLDAREHN